MKKLLKPTLLAILMSLTLASTSNAFSKTPRKTSNTEVLSEGEIKQLTNRLEEIKSMDVSHLTHKQKKELRHEVKAINHTLQSGGGIYLSFGAVIVILLLIILL